jgi:branched-chain amino acid transport system ATP-binding protein
MLAAVSADQRSSAVLHKRFPLPETRDRAEANDAIRRRYLAL